MTDTFSKHSRSLTSAPEHSIAIVPPDAADLVHVIRAPGTWRCGCRTAR